MNRIAESFYYALYVINKKVDKLLKNKMDNHKFIMYKIRGHKELSASEQFTILRDVERVIYGEMKLSSYFEKWGTIYVDEHFWILFKKERPVKPNRIKGSIFDRRFRIPEIK